MSGALNIRQALNVVVHLAVLLPPLALASGGHAWAAEPPRLPLHRTVDLDRGELVQIELSDGNKATVKLLGVEETRDTLRSAIREARVKLEINGRPATLLAAMYQLPRTIAGVQIDCPITKGFYRNCDPFEDSWGLEKDARLRLWPAGSPWIAPGTFVYPAKQRWFANPTQMGNEPSYVDGGDRPPAERPIYYHSGNDIGGCEGLVDVVSACDGLVVSAGGKAMPEYSNAPFYKPRGDYDYVYVLDAHSWFYRYAHLHSIDPAVQPGKRVKMGQKIGVLGKEGSSGGWAHLHFDIKAKQPSGKWGIQDAYPFLWEAYHREHKPQLVAISRPHHLIAAGEGLTLDGSRSWSAAGKIGRYQWTFGDGSTAEGALVERTYEQPGSYSEILKVTDAQGRIDYDFAMVQVLDKDQKERFPPTIHASYAPTFDIRAGDPVTFKVRTFRAPIGNETWDFGDGSPPVKVHSDGNAKPHAPDGYAETIHRFTEPGPYLVRVEGTGHGGTKAVAHLSVRVDEKRPGGAQKANLFLKGWLDRKLLPDKDAESMMRGFLDRQLEPPPLPATEDAWLARRDALRREILTDLGIDDLVPPKWDLAIQSKGTLRRDGYRIEKITFESYPGMSVPAVVYVPDGIQGRVPGIVSITGHTTVSKAADYIQQRNVNLALRGCVVLCYDYQGYGERKTGDHPHHSTGGNSHDIRSFSFTRRSATALEVLDAIRALDVLTARSDVDAGRIAFTGESGGGNSTYWIAALDPRVVLAVPVSAVTTFDYWIRTDVNWDWHQRPPGVRRGADIGTLLALHAPHPLLVISSRRGTDDQEFPLHEAEKSFRWAKHVYGLLSAGDAAAHYESITAHGYQEDKRERLYRAVERWLRPPFSKGDKELPAKVESLDDLRCGLPEDNLTVQAIYSGWLEPLPRVSKPSDPGALRAFLRGRLGWPEPLPELKAKRVGREENGQWSVEFWVLEPEPGIRLPAVRIGGKGANGPMTLIPGRDEQAVADALEAGRQVLAFDPRGTGEIAEGPGSVRNWAWFAGRPGPGQQALDLVQAARFCRATLSAPSVSVDARRGHGWPALLAGAAAPELLASGRVRIPFACLRDQVRIRGDAALADVPGLFERLDIPQLRELWPEGEVSVER